MISAAQVLVVWLIIVRDIDQALSHITAGYCTVFFLYVFFCSFLSLLDWGYSAIVIHCWARLFNCCAVFVHVIWYLLSQTVIALWFFTEGESLIFHKKHETADKQTKTEARVWLWRYLLPTEQSVRYYVQGVNPFNVTFSTRCFSDIGSAVRIDVGWKVCVRSIIKTPGINDKSMTRAWRSLRRWANIGQTLARCVVFAGLTIW